MLETDFSPSDAKSVSLETPQIHNELAGKLIDSHLGPLNLTMAVDPT